VGGLLVKGILGLFNYAYPWIDPPWQIEPEGLADTFSGLPLNGLLKK
jgi:hypothetical protein